MINCTKCGEIKDESQFRPRPKLMRGYNSWCRECELNANRKRYVPKEKKEKKPIDETKVKFSAKKRMLKHRHSIDYDTYLKMYEDQKGKCKICGVDKELGGVSGLFVDHCHSTNKIRGLLCTNCNSGLGKFMDNIELLNNAINYIKQNNDNT